VIEAPPVFFGHSPLLIAMTIQFPAAVAALVYSLIAVAIARDDLGAWPPVKSEVDDAVVTAGTVLPSGQ
jgi:hypothetical protein